MLMGELHNPGMTWGVGDDLFNFWAEADSLLQRVIANNINPRFRPSISVYGH